MKFAAAIIAAVSLLASASALTTPSSTCNRDNCYRDVLGTSGVNAEERLMARRGDCSAILGCTSTPAAAVETTVTTILAGTTTLTLEKSTAQPTNIPGPVSTCGGNMPPAYAPCGGSFERYSSACSCGGITATTSVAPVPTVLATITATQPAVTVYV